jgi:hypothetical protein
MYLCSNFVAPSAFHVFQCVHDDKYARFNLCGDNLIITQFSDPFLCIISTSLDSQYDKVVIVAML